MRKIILFLICFLVTSLVFAQNGNTPNGLDLDKYKPKISKEDKSKEEENDENNEYKNSIKISATHLFRQMLVISYERNVNSRFALKFSGGYCFGKDYFSHYISPARALVSGATGQTKELYDFVDQNKFDHKFNYYVDATGKICTNLLSADFIDLEYKFYSGLSIRNYKQTFLPSNQDITPSDVTELPVKSIAASVVLGVMTYRESTLASEFYLGFGRIHTSFPKYTQHSTDYVYTYDNDKITSNKFMITVGILYGISF